MTEEAEAPCLPERKGVNTKGMGLDAGEGDAGGGVGNDNKERTYDNVVPRFPE